MMIADRLKMSVARAKRETSSSGYLRWVAFIAEDQKARKTEEYGLAMIAHEVHLLRAQMWSGKDANDNAIEFPYRRFNDFFFPAIEVKEEVETPKEISKEEFEAGLAMSKGIWGARLGAFKKKSTPKGIGKK